jgi:6-phosphogluconolactonase (cycloisomerase 2 family)
MGSSSMIGLAGRLLPRVAEWAAASSPVVRFAYVASDADSKAAIHVFRVPADGAWTLVQSVATRAPSSLAVSHDGGTLFVANRVRRHQSRPAGSVESYRIGRRTGKLEITSRRSLALSAVEPEHVAVSPDGKYLVVCATGGGAYNLLPIHADGSLGNVAILRKETGASVNPKWQSSSRPQQVTFDRGGRVISSDLGADRFNVFEIQISELVVRHRHPSEAGSGPSAIQFHPGLPVLFAGGTLDGTVTAHAYDEAHGRLLVEKAVAQAIPQLTDARLHTIAVHPSGNFVIAGWSSAGHHGISAWHFNSDAFSLAPTQVIRSNGAIKILQFTSGGDRLIAANMTDGVISVLNFAQASGELEWSTDLTRCDTPSAIALTYS